MFQSSTFSQGLAQVSHTSIGFIDETQPSDYLFDLRYTSNQTLKINLK